MSTVTEKSVGLVNSFLRGEISAVETYRQCLEKLSASIHRQKLEECRRSHQQRVELLRQWVVQHGGTPAEGSGVWGGFAKLMEGGAKLFGEKSAIKMLEEGEDHGRDDYKRELNNLDSSARHLMESQILPEQLRTHDIMSQLEKSL
jgi:demethoxyubiquinone hydroxylase (CLK1/Coq7/Cat5 family)